LWATTAYAQPKPADSPYVRARLSHRRHHQARPRRRRLAPGYRGDKPNAVGIKFNGGPRHQIPTANSNTPYGISILDLKAGGPMVIELPPGAFIGFVDGHRMRRVFDLGGIGPDKG